MCHGPRWASHRLGWRPTLNQVERVEGDVFNEGELVFDERHFPVVIATWVGTVTDAGIDAYYRWHDRMLLRAAREGVAVVSITDLRGARGVVGPGLRRRFVEEADRREAMIREQLDSVMVVARGSFVLGLVAFILCSIRPWIRLSSFDGLPCALQRALQRLDLAGVARPSWLEPAGYECPMPRRAA